jgi:hypothetical protein
MVWGQFGELRRRWLPVAALLVALVLPAAAGAESEFANPSSIEGAVTKSGGAKLKGVEVCAFDVGEDEEFTECAETKSSGAYEINGLEEGSYRVEFKSGSSGMSLATQWWKHASSIGAATTVHVSEDDVTGIDAEMQVATVTSGVLVGGTLQPDIDGDGFGDLTQDRCPQSSAFHGPCPTVSFLPRPTVTAGAILVKVRASSKAPIAVSGDLPGPGGTPRVVQGVAKGKPATFRLPIPDGLQARLERVPPSRSLALRLKAHAVQVDGAPSTDHLIVQLRGRG